MPEDKKEKKTAKCITFGCPNDKRPNSNYCDDHDPFRRSEESRIVTELKRPRDLDD
jgi:hypothetical protein